MAETDNPCRCRSRIMMSSPRRTTAEPPPATTGRDHRRGRELRLPAGAPPGSRMRSHLGKFESALPGNITPALTQGLARAADLGRDRLDGRVLRAVLALVIQHHPDRALADLRRIGGCALCHGSILSRVGASGKPGAVQ